MRLISFEGRKKIYYLLILFVVSALLYLGIKYVLPKVMPILFAYIVALGLYKLKELLKRKLRVNGKIAALIVTLILIVLAKILIGGLYNELRKQAGNLEKNVDNIMIFAKDCAYGVCDFLGNTFNTDGEKIYSKVEVKMEEVASDTWTIVLDGVVDNSSKIAKGTIDIIVLIVFVFTVIIYMAKYMGSIEEAINKSYFSKEIKQAKKLLKQVIVAYLKAQLLIMLVVIVICTAGLFILKNPYSLMLGIIIGVVDALPILGSSIILIPWTVVMIINENYYYGAMLFTLFFLSYMTREYLEPKIMGKNLGINPVASLIAVYVGYTLFGFFGMITGPLAFMIIIKVMTMTRIKLENNR